MFARDRTLDRRQLLGGLFLGAAAFHVPGLFAEELTRTAPQGEGPFYPDRLPLDTDNDLLILNNALTPAVGTVTHLTGRILNSRGEPLRNAVVEIWQCDHQGIYLHTKSDESAKRDGNFQGFGRFLTDSRGAYYFRTIKPIAYSVRTPHIHFAVKVRGRERFTTECYIEGDPHNEKDPVLQGITDPAARKTLMVDFKPVKDSRVGELAANFDVILGMTPET